MRISHSTIFCGSHVAGAGGDPDRSLYTISMIHSLHRDSQTNFVYRNRWILQHKETKDIDPCIIIVHCYLRRTIFCPYKSGQRKPSARIVPDYTSIFRWLWSHNEIWRFTCSVGLRCISSSWGIFHWVVFAKIHGCPSLHSYPEHLFLSVAIQFCLRKTDFDIFALHNLYKSQWDHIVTALWSRSNWQPVGQCLHHTSK